MPTAVHAVARVCRADASVNPDGALLLAAEAKASVTI